jgi:hypothetical protein
VRSFKWETGISAQGIFGPVRNECEGEDVPILSSKKILVGPKIPWAEIHVTQATVSFTRTSYFKVVKFYRFEKSATLVGLVWTACQARPES